MKNKSDIYQTLINLVLGILLFAIGFGAGIRHVKARYIDECKFSKLRDGHPKDETIFLKTLVDCENSFNTLGRRPEHK